MANPTPAWRTSRSGQSWELPHAPSPGPGARVIPDEAALALERELRNRVRGEVRFDAGSRALYATDGSNYRQVPIGVVIPRSVEDVLATVEACRLYSAPLLSRGGGTSLAGQCCNTAVVLDFSKHLNRILELDPRRKRARVQPGLILDDLRNQAKRHHLTFAPDPSTHTHCTLGGMIGNNSCGVHSVLGGRTSDNVQELDILTYDGVRMRVGATSELELSRIIRQGGRRGEIYARLKGLRDRYAPLIRARYPKIPRRVSGYNLDELLPENGFHVARALVGTESTCVTVLEATVRLVDWPRARSLLVIGYPSVFESGDHAAELVRQPGCIGLEGLDDKLIGFMVDKSLHPDARDWLPEGKGWLLVEFGGRTKLESDAYARAAMARLILKRGAPKMKLLDEPEKEEHLWKIRESGLGATARVPNQPDAWEGFEDSAVPPERLGEYLRDLDRLFKKFEWDVALYGHFGQACVHIRIPFDFKTTEGIRTYRSFMDQATDLVVKYGGSISGEHGDGQSKAEYLGKMYGPELVQAFREFKEIWDPRGRMNPGKIVDPFWDSSNLRLGPSYAPAQVETHFRFPEDKGSLPYAALRCVGVGKCRQHETGTMCPSFMATGEEKHSTRGRAHLLHEMLRGDVIKEGWSSPAVKEALDLCLACKGCKSDCPMNVDMATYKSEFLAHYYDENPRPTVAYAIGLIDQWARIGASMPAVANFVSRAPVVGRLFKELGGIDPRRKVPAFAPVTFKEWWRSRPPRNQGLPQVILWADTFNNHFQPEVAVAAVEVLEAAGFCVKVPETHLCCGRPLYDYGMLELAKDYLTRVIDELLPEIRDGVPVVGLEPSCMAVFRDELPQLFPNDQDGQRLQAQCFLLGEFLEKKAPDFQLPRLERKAKVHMHCHQQAIFKADCDKKVLDRLGIDYEVLDSGCCGMAGGFGYEGAGGKYEVSMRAGERVLLPAVREAPRETLILSDGFSCRSQIEQTTNRRALHLAQVIQMAMREGPAGPPRSRLPERQYVARRWRLFGEKRPVPVLAALAGMVSTILSLRRSRGTRIAGQRWNRTASVLKHKSREVENVDHEPKQKEPEPPRYDAA